MSTPFDFRPPDHERYDLHNINIDDAAARANLCGTVDLHSGRICLLPALHPGGCRFEAPQHRPPTPVAGPR